MGVKHGRDYEHILTDLTVALALIPDSYVFFEMEEEDWVGLPPESKSEVHEALAEDLFFGLGTESEIRVGSGLVIHDTKQHRIHILIGDEEITSVNLI